MIDVKSVVATKLEGAGKHYASDLAAMSHESLEATPGGQARAPYDFTYEVVVVNDRMATLLRGEKPSAWPFEGWAVAPDDFRTPKRAIAEIERSITAAIEAWSALSDDELGREITTSSGSTMTPLDIALMCVQHMGYHDAQLNYVQAMRGDLAVHWE